MQYPGVSSDSQCGRGSVEERSDCDSFVVSERECENGSWRGVVLEVGNQTNFCHNGRMAANCGFDKLKLKLDTDKEL